ncbi:MAG TPA: hypothetical protein VMY38_05030 [Gemmatimonadaceae bacterium]|nr:hypothetical protein [Gemmatimonadaceae bacterium]
MGALFSAFGLAAVIGGAAACGEVTGLEATAATSFDTLSVFPLTGSSATTPTALNTALNTVTPIGPSGNFDVAFDLDAQRRVVLYPVKLIVQPLTGVNEVGLRKVAGTFESVESAPTGLYEAGAPLVLAVGEVAVIEAKRNRSGDICTYSISPNVYSKVVVDSVSTGTNAIWFRIVSNPNCGFRSFAPGLPKN